MGNLPDPTNLATTKHVMATKQVCKNPETLPGLDKTLPGFKSRVLHYYPTKTGSGFETRSASNIGERFP